MRGRVGLDDPAQDHLASLTLPTHPSGPIRVEHLATYTAGFPWLPTNFRGIPPDLKSETLTVFSGVFRGATRMAMDPPSSDQRWRGPTMRVRE